MRSRLGVYVKVYLPGAGWLATTCKIMDCYLTSPLPQPSHFPFGEALTSLLVSQTARKTSITTGSSRTHRAGAVGRSSVPLDLRVNSNHSNHSGDHDACVPAVAHFRLSLEV